MAEETTKEASVNTAAGAPGPRRPLSEAHPDIADRHYRMNALLAMAHDARRRGTSLPEPELSEARGLVSWAEAVAAEAAGDLEAFRRRMERDRAAFAAALRLTGDEQVVAQLLVAADDLRRLL